MMYQAGVGETRFQPVEILTGVVLLNEDLYAFIPFSKID